MLLLLACLTLNDVKTAECKVACRSWGYEDGFFEKNLCKCIDIREYEESQRERIVLPKKRKTFYPRPSKPNWDE